MRFGSAGCMILEVQGKMKGGPHCNIVKDFKFPTAEHRTKCGVLLSPGPCTFSPLLESLEYLHPAPEGPRKCQDPSDTKRSMADETGFTAGTFAFQSGIPAQLCPDMILQLWRSARCLRNALCWGRACLWDSPPP